MAPGYRSTLIRLPFDHKTCQQKNRNNKRHRADPPISFSLWFAQSWQMIHKSSFPVSVPRKRRERANSDGQSCSFLVTSIYVTRRGQEQIITCWLITKTLISIELLPCGFSRQRGASKAKVDVLIKWKLSALCHSWTQAWGCIFWQ